MDFVRTDEKTAFIAHPVDMDILFACLDSIGFDKKCSREEAMQKFSEASPCTIKCFDGLSLDGRRAIDAELVMVPFLPQMNDMSIRKTVGKIDAALALAKNHGCTVAAMGGFTSIVLQNVEGDFERKHGIRITSGNTLTAAIIIRSIEELVTRFGIDLSSSTLAIIGASGDIGSGCMEYFCTRVKTMRCSARGIPVLAAVMERYRDTASAEMVMTDNNAEAVSGADICIFVTSANAALFTQKDFRPGTIVCDASAPVNIKLDGELRDDVFIYHGGIAHVPFALDAGFDIGLPSPKTFYGCQLEGLLIGLHPSLPCSWGRGNISLEKINAFLEVVERYPAIRPAFSIGFRAYDDECMERYAGTWRKNR